MNYTVVLTALISAIDRGGRGSGAKGKNYKQKLQPYCHVSTSNLAYVTECFIDRHQSHQESVDLINASLSPGIFS